MISAALRQAFLDFFAKRKHVVVPSAPLVPRNDPTLMFVNAGMVQFKDVFTGKETRPYTRATSSQKCIRISGKHNDLENVGVTARHHTFFEMLGNFSFGDYFKEEAIASAWELLTDLGVPADRLMITVFAGEEGFAPDDDAAALWRKLSGLPEPRIRRLGMADNFWSMGATGPCGPCSEIHYFHGEKPDYAAFGQEPGADGQGWMEIWNLVFMQYDRAAEGAPPVPLPAPCVDTGAGLERMASVVQGVRSNYDTDILRRLVAGAEDIAKKKYTGGQGQDDVSLRVIADHARTAAFLIAEGIFPDREGREYVLRRVMRRAIRHGHRLGIKEPFLHLVAKECAAAMGDAYPELKEREQLIASVAEREEIAFRATIERGLELIAKNKEWLSAGGKQTMPGAVAFKLYDTFGFPLDLTEVIGKEQGFAVDVAGYERELAAQRQRSAGSKVGEAALDAAYLEVASRTKTEFSGYERELDESEVTSVFRLEQVDGRFSPLPTEHAKAGDEIELATARTPFYAESGGQVGDQGEIRGKNLVIRVSDTQKPTGVLILHRGRIEQGEVSVGDKVTLEVDHARRAATRRNHSATHLLHWALKTVLGEHAQQKGSLVGPDVLRFDFAHGQALTAAEIERVEDLVNGKVLTAAPVQTEVLPIAEAKKKGAVAIFEEKYGEVVRVLTMTADSVELCGGTHCRSLGEIGLFKILGESGTAAGVRRIFAATGNNALAHLRRVEQDLARARAAAKATGGADLAERIDKMNAHERQLEKRVKELEKRLLEGGSAEGGGLPAMLAQAKTAGDVRVLGVRAPDGAEPAALRELCEKLRDKLGPRAVVLAASRGADKAMLVLMVSKQATDNLKAGDLIRPIAAKVGGSGGGRPDMAQAGGPNIAGIDEAVAALVPAVEAALR